MTCLSANLLRPGAVTTLAPSRKQSRPTSTNGPSLGMPPILSRAARRSMTWLPPSGYVRSSSRRSCRSCRSLTDDAQPQLNLLRTLVIWSLTSSDEISKTIKDSYKQSRHEDDLNQPLSVQPWGADDDKRRYWLIEGQDDTSFRLYREGNRALKNVTWRSMAGTIDEVKDVCAMLDRKHTTQAARRLTARITSAIPRFEATEEVCCCHCP